MSGVDLDYKQVNVLKRMYIQIYSLTFWLAFSFWVYFWDDIIDLTISWTAELNNLDSKYND